MMTPDEELRPPVSVGLSFEEFTRWYWSVECLHEFCNKLGLPKSGTKAALRERVAVALGKPVDRTNGPKSTVPMGQFDWSKADLNNGTLITDNVKFGPHVRRWFTDQIGDQFVCNGDFMDWVRSNSGATLGDAIQAWFILEKRKEQAGFRRNIALCNNYLRYLRTFRDDNQALSHGDAMQCWHAKKLRPAKYGTVIYERDDLRFLRLDE